MASAEAPVGSPRAQVSERHTSRGDAVRQALRIAVGAVVALGVLHHLTKGLQFGAAIAVVAFIAALLGLLTVPWFVRLGRSLSFERAARIREQERAELAAHLHDSVLQTLALIQKRAGDPREVAGLARRQERELRSWLLKRPGEAEQVHGVPIEVVTVGDAPLSGGLEAMVQAAREAMTNAAKFAGSERVDLY